MENTNNDVSESRDALYLVGGVSLIVLGVGLVMTHPTIRKTLLTGLSAILPEMKGKFGLDLSAIGPDVERYLKLKSM